MEIVCIVFFGLIVIVIWDLIDSREIHGDSINKTKNNCSNEKNIKYNNKDNQVLVKQGIKEENIMNSDSGSNNSIIFLKGRNGTVSVEKNVVIIRREGVMGFFASGAMGKGIKEFL